MAGDGDDHTRRDGGQPRWKEIAQGASPFLVFLLLIVFIAIMVIIYVIAV